MEFKQFYLGCLAHASYLVGDTGEVGDGGECAIVDPQRDVDQYLQEAAARGLTIRHVIETHLHADFVSGHVELARRTGATIHIGRRAGAAFPHHPLADGDELAMGSVVLRVLETPGHTPEGISVLVFDRARGEAPRMVLTGDTLFIGDVGRPDLVSAKGCSARDMAGLMYDSLRAKLMTLPDGTEVFPAHGAGSACGRNISSALSSTIGEQKRLNWALQPMSREDFVAAATADLPPSPRYFSRDAEINRLGAPALSELPPPPALSPAEVEQRLHDGAIVLDVRDAASFGAGHVPGSVNIGLSGSIAPWAGALLRVDVPIVLVAGAVGQLSEAVVRLARVGLHDVVGSLDGGLAAWAAAGRPIESVPQLTVDVLAGRLAAQGGRGAARGAPAGQLLVLDVRRPGEHQAGHVPGALNLPLNELEQRLGEVDATRPVAVICASGYRSSAAASLLQRAGWRDVANVTGGTNAWIAAGHPAETSPAEIATS